MELIGLPAKPGAFSDVFINTQEGKAYKLFISFQNPRSNKYEYDEASFDRFRRDVFNSENEAYKILEKTELSEYIPKYYGNPDIERVINSQGVDISSYYLLDCCIAMELVEGESWKQARVDREDFLNEYNVNLDSIFNKMKSHGVSFTIDSNVIIFENGFKIIDFALQDFSNFE